MVRADHLGGWHENGGADEDGCVGFPDGEATPSFQQFYRWVQQSGGAVVDPLAGIAEQPIILPFRWDTTNSHNNRTPWQIGRIQCTRQNSPNKRRDTTVRVLISSGQRTVSGPSVSLRRGFGDAGKTIHMGFLGERRQNGGDFSS